MKRFRYLLFTLTLATLNLGSVLIFFGFLVFLDSQQYVDTIRFFLGDPDAPVHLHRLLRPLGPLLAVPFEFIGLGAGLLIQNIFFYFFSVGLVFLIINRLFHDQKQALYASVLFFSAMPVLKFGLGYLTDMGAWFFYLFSVFLALLYREKDNVLFAVVAAFVSSAGVLMKENGGMGILFLCGLILLSHQRSLKKKTGIFFLAAVVFLIPIVLFQIFMHVNFSYTYLDWFLYNKTTYVDQSGIGSLLLLHLYGLFQALHLVGWVFGGVGLWIFQKTKQYRHLYPVAAAFILPSFSFLLWPASESRLTFMIALFAIMFASLGIRWVTKTFFPRYSYSSPFLILAAYAMVNMVSVFVEVGFGVAS